MILPRKRREQCLGWGDERRFAAGPAVCLRHPRASQRKLADRPYKARVKDLKRPIKEREKPIDLHDALEATKTASRPGGRPAVGNARIARVDPTQQPTCALPKSLPTSALPESDEKSHSQLVVTKGFTEWSGGGSNSRPLHCEKSRRSWPIEPVSRVVVAPWEESTAFAHHCIVSQIIAVSSSTPAPR